MSAEPLLTTRQLAKHYGDVAAVDGVDLTVQEGEFVTLLGPSGCGKTTTLRLIAGYVEPTAGQILLDGADVTRIPPQRRNMGMVFQSYALFPHLTVFDNIAFALRVRKWAGDKIRAKVREMLGLVQLPDIEGRYPRQLSGGQQQRVALARALAFGPRILLMDEALGALDVKLREHMQGEIKRIQHQLGVTTLHVTHDQEEALSMSDRVVVMHQGRIAQIDTPKQLYERPATAYVADFVGKINLFPARVVATNGSETELELTDPTLAPDAPRRVIATTPPGSPTSAAAPDPSRSTAALDSPARITTPPSPSAGTAELGASSVSTAAPHLAVGATVQIGVRPEYLTVQRQPASHNCIGGRARGVKYIGPLQYLTLQVAPERTALALDPTKADLAADLLYACWPPDKTLVFPDAS